MLLAALQLLTFARCLRPPSSIGTSPRLTGAAVTGVASFGSIFLLLFGTTMAVAHAVAVRRAPWRSIWLPAGLAALPAAAYYLTGSALTAPRGTLDTHLTQPFFENLIYLPYGLLFAPTFGPPSEQLHGAGRYAALQQHLPALGVAALLGMGLGYAVWKAVRVRGTPGQNHRENLLFLLVLLLGSVVVGCLFMIVARLNWLPRHSSPMAIPLYLTVAVALCSLAQMTVAQAIVSGTLGLGLVAANCASLRNYYSDSHYSRGDYRSVSAFVRESREAGMVPVLLWGDTLLLEHYKAGPVADARDLSTEELGPRLRDAVSAAGTVLLVVNRPFYAPDSAIVIRAVGDRYTLRVVRTFPQFRLYALGAAETKP